MKISAGTKLAMLSSKLGAFFTVGLMAVMATLTAFAEGQNSVAGPDLTGVTSPVVGLLKSVFAVMIPVVGAAGAIFCVFLGVKYSKAEEPQEREKAKGHLKAAIIGFVIIFVLVVALEIGTNIMSEWTAQTIKDNAAKNAAALAFA